MKVDPHPICVLSLEGGGRNTDTQGEHSEMTEAETGVMWPQAKECQGLATTTGAQEKARKESKSVALLTPLTMYFDLQNCERIHFCCCPRKLTQCGPYSISSAF